MRSSEHRLTLLNEKRIQMNLPIVPLTLVIVTRWGYHIYAMDNLLQNFDTIRGI